MRLAQLPAIETIRELDRDCVVHQFYGPSNRRMTKAILRGAIKLRTAWESNQDPCSCASLGLSSWTVTSLTSISSPSVTSRLRATGACIPGASYHMWQVPDSGSSGAVRMWLSVLRIVAADAMATGINVCPARFRGVRMCPDAQNRAVNRDLERPDEEIKPASLP